MKKQRTLELRNIYLPISVKHGHLSKESRIDRLSERIDILLLTVKLRYEWRAVSEKNMEGVFNYSELYNELCLGKMMEISGPLEGILDKTIEVIEASARKQNVVLYEVKVEAQRKGLSVGSPILRVGKIYQSEESDNALSVKMKDYRSAGIDSAPLVVQVNHEWCQENERVEHVDNRVEQVAVSFNAETLLTPLTDDLTGLYNYASLMNAMQSMHNTEIHGPIEMLSDIIAEKLFKMALVDKVSVSKVNVEVVRTGYARCTPIIGLNLVVNVPDDEFDRYRRRCD